MDFFTTFPKPKFQVMQHGNVKLIPWQHCTTTYTSPLVLFRHVQQCFISNKWYLYVFAIVFECPHCILILEYYCATKSNKHAQDKFQEAFPNVTVPSKSTIKRLVDQFCQYGYIQLFTIKLYMYQAHSKKAKRTSSSHPSRTMAIIRT